MIGLGSAALEPIAGAWFRALAPRALEASLLAVLVLLLVRLGARRLSGPVRHGLLVLVLLKFLLPPIPAPWAPAGWLPGLELAAAEIATPQGASGLEIDLPSDPLPARDGSGGPSIAADGRGPAHEPRPHASRGAAELEAADPSIGIVSTAASRRPALPLWPTLLALHLAGALGLALRHAVQRRRLARLARRCAPIRRPELERALRSAGGRQGVRRLPALVASPDRLGPAAAGLLRRRIVLPHEVLERLPAERLAPVLEHELAHHRRGDLWLDVVVFAGSLVWWPCPVYWLIARELRRVREDCCDAAALVVVSPGAYCRALLDVAEALGASRPALPALAHGTLSHPLGRRIRTIMTSTRTPRSALGTPALLALAAAALVFLPSARAETPAPGAGSATAGGVGTATTAAAAIPVASASGAPTSQSLSIRNDEIDLDRRGIDRLVENGLSRELAEQLDGTRDRRLSLAELREWTRHGIDPELADELAAWGHDGVWVSEVVRMVWSEVSAAYLRSIREIDYADFDLDDLIRLARYEVAADWIEGWSEGGYDELDADDLVRLTRYEVEPGYAATFKEADYSLSVDDLVRLHRYEVDEDAVQRLSSAGVSGFSVDDLVRMQRYEVRDDYVRMMTADGTATVSVDDLVRLKRYEVEPAYAAAFRDAGIEVSTDDLIRMKRYEVTPQTATRLLGMGYRGIDVDGLITLNRYEVTPEFVEGMAAATSRTFAVDELVRLKRYEVGPEWVGEMAAVGFGELGVDDMVRLKRYEVTADFVRRLQQAGFEDLTIDKIIRLKRADS